MARDRQRHPEGIPAEQRATAAHDAATRAEADRTAAEGRAAEARATTERLRAEIDQVRAAHSAELDRARVRTGYAPTKCVFCWWRDRIVT